MRRALLRLRRNVRHAPTLVLREVLLPAVLRVLRLRNVLRQLRPRLRLELLRNLEVKLVVHVVRACLGTLHGRRNLVYHVPVLVALRSLHPLRPLPATSNVVLALGRVLVLGRSRKAPALPLAEIGVVRQNAPRFPGVDRRLGPVAVDEPVVADPLEGPNYLSLLRDLGVL